jgi:hypothetical protein
MKAKQNYFLLVILILIGLTVYFEAQIKPEVSWQDSFAPTDAAPKGARIFTEQFKQKVKTQHWQQVKIPTYEWLLKPVEKGVYFLYNDRYAADNAEVKKLLSWVNDGGMVFIAANRFPDLLLDSLNIKLETKYDVDTLLLQISQYTEVKEVKNPRLVYFHDIKSPHQVLGTASENADAKSYANLIKVPFGEGWLMLHAFPEAFTNYFILDDEKRTYTENLLGYLPLDQNFYYDAYYKTGNRSSATPLYLLLAQPQLKSAYYTLLAMIFLWVIFEGKRKQRIIPEITPPTNQTLDFARSIAGLYARNRNLAELHSIQLNLFVDYCISQYQVHPFALKPTQLESLSAKSNCSSARLSAILTELEKLKEKENFAQQDIMYGNKLIEEFKSYKHAQPL